MINFYIPSKRLRVKCKGLSGTGVISISETEHDFAVHFLKKFIKTSKPGSDND